MNTQSDTHRRTPWFTLARALWMVLAIAALVIVLVSTSANYEQRNTLSFNLPPGWTPDTLRAGLGQLGLSTQVFALYSTGLRLFLVLGLFVLSAVIFTRKSAEPMALLVAIFLMALAGEYGNLGAVLDFNAPALYANPLFWLYGLVGFMAWVGFCAFFYTFPDGRFVPRWTAWTFPLVVVLQAFANFISPKSPMNPPNWPPLLFSLAVLGFLATLVVAPIYRYRRVATPIQRQQIKWVVFTAPIAILASAALNVIPTLLILPNDVSVLYYLLTTTLVQISFLLIPLSLAIAILRYRLWDIDVVIRRTLQYSVLTAMLALVYFGGVVILQRIFTRLTGQGQNQLVTVLSTLAIAALFNPIRRRVQDLIDRRFYRKKYDAAKTLAEFAATVRDETDLDKLAASLIAVVQETMQPESISLWLKDFNAKTPRRHPQAGAGDAKDGIHP
jgi:hypothetical protein